MDEVFYDYTYVYRNGHPIFSKIAQHIGDVSLLTYTQLIERVQCYVFESSKRAHALEGDDYKIPTKQVITILTDIWNYHEGIRSIPVGLYCQAHVVAMAAILYYFRIISREIAILRVHDNDLHKFFFTCSFRSIQQRYWSMGAA